MLIAVLRHPKKSISLEALLIQSPHPRAWTALLGPQHVETEKQPFLQDVDEIIFS